VNGNKYFKLKYNLEEMKKLGQKTMLTFGGAFSNHIAALASVGKSDGFKTIGMIRGEELNENSNQTLRTAIENGMQLHFVTREEYRKRYRPEYHEELKAKFGDLYILPEGGSNQLGVKGCSEILQDVNQAFDFVCLPVGTGATLAGIASSLNKTQQVIGFAVLANAQFLDEDVTTWRRNSPERNLITLRSFTIFILEDTEGRPENWINSSKSLKRKTISLSNQLIPPKCSTDLRYDKSDTL